MKFMSKSSAQKYENSATCTVYEYGGDKDIDGAVAIINGRYPETGWAMNTAVKEMVYVISGSGQLATNETTATLHEGDVVLLTINEPYYFDGENLKVFMPTTPPWSPDQHLHIVD